MIDAGFSGVTVRRALEDIAGSTACRRARCSCSRRPCSSPRAARASTAPARSRAASGACCSRRSTSCSARSTRHGRACSIPSRRSAASARSGRWRRRTARCCGCSATCVLCGALAVLLGSSWIGVALSAGLGVIVGTVLLVGERLPSGYGALLTVGMAFVVALAVFLLLRAGFGPGDPGRAHRAARGAPARRAAHHRGARAVDRADDLGCGASRGRRVAAGAPGRRHRHAPGRSPGCPTSTSRRTPRRSVPWRRGSRWPSSASASPCTSACRGDRSCGCCSCSPWRTPPRCSVPPSSAGCSRRSSGRSSWCRSRRWSRSSREDPPRS